MLELHEQWKTQEEEEMAKEEDEERLNQEVKWLKQKEEQLKREEAKLSEEEERLKREERRLKRQEKAVWQEEERVRQIQVRIERAEERLAKKKEELLVDRDTEAETKQRNSHNGSTFPPAATDTPTKTQASRISARKGCRCLLGKTTRQHFISLQCLFAIYLYLMPKFANEFGSSQVEARLSENCLVDQAMMHVEDRNVWAV
jgi:predicted RNase H-like nuclease (RuvC/YqgF family)